MPLDILKPPFNPLDMKLEFFSSSQIQAEQQRFDDYNSPQAQQERADQRALEQSGIISGLQAQCRLDRAASAIAESEGVIFISAFSGVDCEVPSGVLSAATGPNAPPAMKASGDLFNSLITDAPFETTLKIDPAVLDQSLIKKYEVLLKTWCDHVFLNGLFIGRNVPFLFPTVASIQPGIRNTGNIHTTCVELYLTIKDYNKRHKEFTDSQITRAVAYYTPEAAQTRLEQRIASSGQITAQIASGQVELAALSARLQPTEVDGVIVFPSQSLIDQVNVLSGQITLLQDQVAHPEIDPPFQQDKDNFDEQLNASFAMVFFFMKHLVQYISITFVEVNEDTKLTMTDSVLSVPACMSTAKKIKDQKGSTSIFPPAVLEFVNDNLIKHLSEHLMELGKFTGTTNIHIPPIPPPGIKTNSEFKII